MAPVQWTKAQKDAIMAKGGPLLVSAAAGSGKTAVLSERVVRILTDENEPVSADRLLIATFSNAAAAEMKERIEIKLEQALQQCPDSTHLHAQLQALQHASIGTIHAFCLDLIRTHFQQIGLSAQVRIGDEQEIQVLRRNLLEDIIIEEYERNDPLFLHTVELFSSTRDDKRFASVLLRLYDFTRAHPFPERWLTEKLALYEKGQAISSTVWACEILSWSLEAVQFCLTDLSWALSCIQNDEKLEEAYGEAFRKDIEQFSLLQNVLLKGEWDDICKTILQINFAKLRPLRGYDNDILKKRLGEIRQSAKDIIETLSTRFFCANSQAVYEDIEDLRPKIEMLFELVIRFSQRFEAAKNERQMLDFSDLEQYAVLLLYTADNTTDIEESVLAKQLKKEYDYIFIDEFQDTNETQELIFSAISNGKNLFMVGDVKQSIYGFRQANPKIFMKKKENFPYYNGTIYPAKIILGANFRSHPAICEGINGIFNALMSHKVGEIDYNEDERLIPLGTFSENLQAGISLEIIEGSREEDSSAWEAEHVAKRIEEILTSQMMVQDKENARPVRPGDIAILLRSPKDKAGIYLRALANRGIPASSSTQSGFMQTLEISTVFSLLRAINNPLQDISLAAALTSPIYGFTADDLTRIRLYNKKLPLYYALLEAQKNNDEQCIQFLSDLRDFRSFAAQSTVHDLIRYLYRKTQLPDLMLAMKNESVRRANLILLLEYCKTYEKAGYRTVSQFLRFVENLEENGGDFQSGDGLVTNENVVRVMSIHRSKGLEFPIVFLADTAKQFNRDDLRQNVILHGELGFACVRRDEETMSQFTTIPLEAVRLAVQREMISEEMRILYVAMTRAKQQLIITGMVENIVKKVSSAIHIPVDAGRFGSYGVGNVRSYLDWFLMCALAGEQGNALRLHAALPKMEETALEIAMQCKVIVHTTEEKPEYEEEQRKQLPAAWDQTLLEQIRQQVIQCYRYEEATKIPVKLAVTALVREKRNEIYMKKPRFITHEKISAAMRGNAFHQYMRFADHNKGCMDVKGEIDALYKAQFLSSIEVKALDAAMIERFYRSTLFKRMQRSVRVEREYRFLAQLGKKELGDFISGLGGETVTVQGICDALFFEEGKVVIVDYKTDRVKNGNQLKVLYHGQLELYARLIHRILDVPIKECILYSAVLGEEVGVEIEP